MPIYIPEFYIIEHHEHVMHVRGQPQEDKFYDSNVA